MLFLHIYSTRILNCLRCLSGYFPFVLSFYETFVVFCSSALVLYFKRTNNLSDFFNLFAFYVILYILHLCIQHRCTFKKILTVTLTRNISENNNKKNTELQNQDLKQVRFIWLNKI